MNIETLPIVLINTLKHTEYLPIPPVPNQSITVSVMGGSKEYDIFINTYYDDKSYISIKYKDAYLVSNAGFKYLVNYLLLSDDKNEAIFFLPISVNESKKSINYSDLGNNIGLYYGIMEIPNETI